MHDHWYDHRASTVMQPRAISAECHVKLVAEQSPSYYKVWSYCEILRLSECRCIFFLTLSYSGQIVIPYILPERRHTTLLNLKLVWTLVCYKNVKKYLKVQTSAALDWNAEASRVREHMHVL